MDEIYTIDLGAGYFPICIGMDPTGRFAVVTNLGDNSAYIIVTNPHGQNKHFSSTITKIVIYIFLQNI